MYKNPALLSPSIVDKMTHVQDKSKHPIFYYWLDHQWMQGVDLFNDVDKSSNFQGYFSKSMNH